MRSPPAVKSFRRVRRALLAACDDASCLAYLKKWLREHRSHPYPTNEEKMQLAKQSSITYDQVTTWFNNARAILRRRQAKLRHSFDVVEDKADDNDDDDGGGDDDDQPSPIDNKKRTESTIALFRHPSAALQVTDPRQFSTASPVAPLVYSAILQPLNR